MLENEVILLRAVYDHIGEMVNYSLMDVCGTEPNSMIRFKDMNHKKLFFILLVDFLSKTDKRGPLKQTIFLRGLVDICNNPQFSIDQSERNLKMSVNAFKCWLDEEILVDIWMP